MLALPMVDQRPSTVAVFEWDHDLLVAEDPNPCLQELVEVPPREPVGGDEAGVARQQDPHVHLPLYGLDKPSTHRPVGDEVGVGKANALVGVGYRVEVLIPDREDAQVRIVEANSDVGFPIALANRL